VSEPEQIGSTEVAARLAARVDGLAGDVEIGDPHTESAEQARERLAGQAASKVARWRSRVPDDYRDAALADFDMDLHDKALRFLRDPGARHFVAAGPVGTGKTHLGYALGNAASAEALWAEAWTVHDLMQSQMPEQPVPAWQVEAWVRNCDVLLLDDLGATRVTPFAIDTVTALLDHRVGKRRKTIITTNATEPALRAVWGDRLMDRIRQGLVAQKFEGRSRRQPAW
jgi:DNA replication protein DnaC